MQWLVGTGKLPNSLSGPESASAVLSVVLPEDIGFVWPKVEFLVAKIAAPTHTPGDMKEEFQESRKHLWIIWDGTDTDNIHAIVVTSIHQYPLQKTCHIVGCVGSDFRQWVHLLEKMEAWAKREGCDVLEMSARLGWKKVLQPMGYNATHIRLDKGLHDA